MPAEYIKRGEKILRDAEAGLRELVAASAGSAEYQEIQQLLEWARGLNDLAGRPSSNLTGSEATLPKRTAHKAVRSPSPTSDAAYPRFSRTENDLIRVAWSRRERREYTHKAPRRALDAVAHALQRVGANGKVFASDSFLPLNDGDGAQFPNYQIYVVLSLLKHLSIIDQHGRKGYSISRPSDLANASDAVWKRLPAQRRLEIANA